VSKKQRYSLKPIRRNYTYSVYEVAELYSITPDTVFRWIRSEGLNRIAHSRKFFVHSGDLTKFLEKRNSKYKRPCKDGEIYCCKCRKPQKPKSASLKFKKIPNKTIRVLGRCSICDTRINTVVSDKKWSERHLFYPDMNASTKPHSGEHVSPRKCQTRRGEQLCLNITP
jgi:hypothetical protein